MTTPQSRLSGALRRRGQRRQPEAVWHREFEASGMTAEATAGPTAVQLAIQLAQSLDSAPHLEDRSTSVKH